MKAIKIFYRLQFSRIIKELSLPTHAMFTTFGSMIFFVVHLLGFKVFLQNVSFIGWTVIQLWGLLLVFELYTYSCFLLFWRGILYTTREIKNGHFDTLLAKPINSIFSAFFRSGGIHNFFLSFLSFILVIIWAIVNQRFIYFPMFLVAFFISLIGFYGLTILIVSLGFFWPESSWLSGFGFEVQESYKYPVDSLLNKKPIFYLIAPLAALVSVPAMVLVGRPVENILWMIYLFFVSAIFLLGLIFWNYGLRHYSSASS